MPGKMIKMIDDVIRDFLEDQPYSVRCNACGEELNCDTEIDIDLDMIVHVDPCPKGCNQ